MNELKIVNESEYTGEEASPAITFVNSEDGSRVVFAGNVAEYGKINNQEKSVEITEAGVTEIVPDKGYTGLSKVSVDTSAISGVSDGEFEYFDITKFLDDQFILMDALALATRTAKAHNSNNGLMISPIGALGSLGDITIKALEVDFNIPFINSSMSGTIRDYMNASGISNETINALPRITKEQFYDLNA